MQVPLFIIRELLKGKHIDVKERIQRGSPVTATLEYADILRVLIDMLQEFKYFPYNFNDPEYKNYEGISIERTDNKYVCRAQRMLPMEPDVIAEKASREFDNVEDAAEFYLKWALNLPGNLDGYKVIK